MALAVAGQVDAARTVVPRAHAAPPADRFSLLQDRVARQSALQETQKALRAEMVAHRAEALAAVKAQKALRAELGANLSRARAVMRGARPAADGGVTAATPGAEAPDGLLLDDRRLCVAQGGKGVRLTPTEWQLLAVLMRSGGAVLSRPELSRLAWGTSLRPQEVEVYICRLRRKLAKIGGSTALETVRGAGYRFRPELCRAV